MSQTPDERFKELLKTIENITYPNLWIVEDFNKENTVTPYTPKPWKILDESGDSSKQDEIIIMGWDEKAGESFDIAHVIIGEGVDAQANAKLIAAAPELLEALKLCAMLINKRVTAGKVSVDFLKIQNLAFSAIAKATGGLS